MSSQPGMKASHEQEKRNRHPPDDERPQEPCREAFSIGLGQALQQDVDLVGGHTGSLMAVQLEIEDSSPAPKQPEVSGDFVIPPPGTALEVFVSQMTPPGALTWKTLPADLPWTRPPNGRRSRSRPRTAQLAEVLAGAGVKNEVAQEYVLHGPMSRLVVYSPRELDRNHGCPARAIEVAAEHDIAGSDLADIATRLDLSDHQLTVPGLSKNVVGDPRGGRRYLQRGRQLLSALGVWPWAHVANWSRSRRWWLDPEVRSALLTWHDDAWMHAAAGLAFNARARYGHVQHWSITVEEFHACKDFRARLIALAERNVEASQDLATE